MEKTLKLVSYRWMAATFDCHELLAGSHFQLAATFGWLLLLAFSQFWFVAIFVSQTLLDG